MSSPTRMQTDDAEFSIVSDTDTDLTVGKDADSGFTTLYSAMLVNTTNTLCYVSLWDDPSGTVAGGGEAFRFIVPANGGSGITVAIYNFFEGHRFDNGFSWLGHTALDGTGDPGANALIVAFDTSAGRVYIPHEEDDDPTFGLSGGTYTKAGKALLGTQLYEDPSSIATARQFGSGAQVFFGSYIDNTANAAAHAFLKLYNAAAPTIGTDEPSIIVRAYKGRTCRMSAKYVSAAGVVAGIPFATAMTRVTTGTGGVGGSSLASVVSIKVAA